MASFTRVLSAMLASIVLIPFIPAYGQLPEREVQKLLASDGAPNDDFGWSVAVDGNTAVVGARGEDSDGLFSNGAVYVFTRDGSGLWTEQAKLLASDRARNNEYFGYSVDLDGDTVLVGAEGGGSRNGAAYVFTRDGSGTWAEQATLLASDGRIVDRFGNSVALDGDTALIGARHEDSDGLTDNGAAYVFVRDGSGSWAEQAKLLASDKVTSDFFGGSVALDGDTAVIAASSADSGELIATGAVYIFTRDGGGNWTEQAKLLASDKLGNGHFGDSVSMDGNTLVIGAGRTSSDGSSITGGAYVFTRDASGAWTEQTKLIASDIENTSDGFGSSVVVDGNTIVMGAPRQDSDGLLNTNDGAAYVFIRDGSGAWTEQTKLLASDRAANDEFGFSVALDGGTVVIGAHFKGLIGAAYVFAFDDEPQFWFGSRGGVTTDGNQVTYSGLPTGWVNTVNSVQLSTLGFADDFEVRFRLNSDPGNTVWVVGLGTTESGAGWRDIEFGLRSSNGTLNVRENGDWRAVAGLLAIGDVISIYVNSGAIEYRLNGVAVYNSRYVGSPDFYVDTAFKKGPMSMSVFVAGDPSRAETPISTWLREKGGVSTSEGEIVYSGSPTGWWKNAVTSSRFSTLGFMDDYEVRFTIDSDPSGTTWIVGLGIEEDSAHWTDVEFGLRSSAGMLNIRENGDWRTGGDMLAMGDVISIRVIGGAIEYRHNGAVIYTSAYVGTPDFYVDSSFRDGSIAIGVSIAD